MSQIISYVKSLLHPKDKKDRKRRNENAVEVLPQFPKYRRVSNVFPERYGQLADDEIDYFQVVKNNQGGFNEILGSFLLTKQRKQFKMINDNEFSDDDDDLSSIPAPAASNRLSNSQKPSTSGFKFNPNPLSSTSSFNFTNKHNGVQFTSTSKPKLPMQRRAIPDLLPISRSVKPPTMSNGCSNGQQYHRRSVLDFTKKNRAFNDSPAPKLAASAINHFHNLHVHNEYNNLLKKLIPQKDFDSKAPAKRSEFVNFRQEPIETVDLSTEEPDYSNSASALPNYATHRISTPPLYRLDKAGFKKPSMYVEVSDDEDTEPSFDRHPFISSTLIKTKSQRPNALNIQKQTSSPVTVSEVPPVNSLRDRQQSRSCLHDDAISSIVQKYEDSRIKNNSKIREAAITANQLSNDTAVHEILQQRKLDETVTSLRQCIILDEEDEKIEEFPALTDQMLQIVHYGLNGPRSEVLASKFNMKISRQDLNTLDGLNWLNDEVINYYMELLKLRSEEVKHLPKVHVMNTFFIPKLLSAGHSGVRRWTRKVDIFGCDIFLIPVHVGGVHWCMSVIDMREKSINYYDSMGHPNMAVLDGLKRYLEEESMDKRNIKLDTSDWTAECIKDCPQQRNGSDCGVFSCMFAEFLSRDSKITFDQQHMQYFRRKMIVEIIQGKLILGY